MDGYSGVETRVRKTTLDTAPSSTKGKKTSRQKLFESGLLIAGTLLLFLFALDLMISTLEYIGSETIQSIIHATSNPFAALFFGLLITAMMQSSSTTTALVVAMVASGNLTLHNAIPVVMGANIGTTITALIVSLGFISSNKELKRGVAAGSYHCFFNLLTVSILFPLEYYFGSVTNICTTIAGLFSDTATVFRNKAISSERYTLFAPASSFLIHLIKNGWVLMGLSFGLLFSSVLLFRRVISGLMRATSPEAFSRFFFDHEFKSFFWGITTTAAIRSSTITTSVVVPMVAKKIVSFRKTVPFILGANIGTTITGFIALTSNTATSATISIALSHFVFNGIGVIIFLLVPGVKALPAMFARGLGDLAGRNRWTVFVFILTVFFAVPLALGFFSQE